MTIMVFSRVNKLNSLNCSQRTVQLTKFLSLLKGRVVLSTRHKLELKKATTYIYIYIFLSPSLCPRSLLPIAFIARMHSNCVQKSIKYE